MIPVSDRPTAPACRDILERVTRRLAPRSAAILVRTPIVDARFPDTSDLDLLVLADVGELRSERIRERMPDGAITMIDVAWLPWAWFDAPDAAAARGWVPHRLLSSALVFDAGRNVASLLDAVRQCLYRRPVQERRLKAFLDVGAHTVREIGVTWDFPALALFWLHMAHGACLGAALDGLQRLCPNVFTRPLDYLDALEQDGPGVRRAWVEALRLDADPEILIGAVHRVHALVARRFPEPAWPEAMRAGTRFEYRYWLSSDELAWRSSVAREMVRRGESAGAVFYLRFCAYAIARLPMVHAQAAEGSADTSFLRPDRAVAPELRRLAPEILDDLALAFAGTTAFGREEVTDSLTRLQAFRDLVVRSLREHGAPVPELEPWAPYNQSRP